MHHEPPSLSLVVFDLDGTLVDSRGDIVAAANEALADLGLAPLDETTMGAFVGDGASALMHRAAEASLARSGRTVSAADLDTLGRRGVDGYVHHYCRHPVERTTWMPGVVELLDDLRDVAVGVCTNKPRAPTEAVLAGMGLADRVRVLVAGGDLPQKKPDPAPLRVMMARAEAVAEATLMIGDGPQDVGCANAAGVRSLAVCGGFASREALEAAGPTWLVDSMHEARPIVRALRGL